MTDATYTHISVIYGIQDMLRKRGIASQVNCDASDPHLTWEMGWIYFRNKIDEPIIIIVRTTCVRSMPGGEMVLDIDDPTSFDKIMDFVGSHNFFDRIMFGMIIGWWNLLWRLALAVVFYGTAITVIAMVHK